MVRFNRHRSTFNSLRRTQSSSEANEAASDSRSAPENQQAYDRAIAMANLRSLNWRTLTMTIPAESGSAYRFVFDSTIGGQPHQQTTLTMERCSLVGTWSTFSDNSPGRQARMIVRFLHTGEVLGLAGQVVAGLASLASALLVWSGLALAWRRLIRPFLRRAAVPGPDLKR